MNPGQVRHAEQMLGPDRQFVQALRQQAVQRQQRGEHAQALADLHNAVLFVQRALAAAGLAMPAPVE